MSSHTVAPTRDDQANSGTRRSVIPGARSASTVVPMQIHATASARSTSRKATTNSRTPSTSLPKGPPSMA